MFPVCRLPFVNNASIYSRKNIGAERYKIKKTQVMILTSSFFTEKTKLISSHVSRYDFSAVGGILLVVFFFLIIKINLNKIRGFVFGTFRKEIRHLVTCPNCFPFPIFFHSHYYSYLYGRH